MHPPIRPLIIILAAVGAMACGTACQPAESESTAEQVGPRPPLPEDYIDYGLLNIDGELLHPRPQDTRERSWEERATFVKQMGGSPDSDVQEQELLYTPLGLVVSDDEQFAYVVDRGRLQVRVFDLARGVFVRSVGKGEGEGPGEFRDIRKISVDRDGGVTVLDTRRRLTRFASDGSIEGQLKFKYHAFSFAAVDSGYVLLSGLNYPEIFHALDRTGNVRWSKGAFARNPLLNLGMTGNLIDSEDGFVWVGFYAGRFAGFDRDGGVRFYRETIYPTPPPRMEGRTLAPVEGPVRVRVPVNTNDGELFVTIADTSVGQDKLSPFVDAFSMTDGSYRYTIPNPDDGASCSIWYVTREHLYTMCIEEGTLKQWKRSRELR